MTNPPASDDQPVTAIRNLGPAIAASLARVGITTAGQLREIGADAAYQKLLASGIRPHFIGYYVLHMGLQGRPWNDCKGDEKRALRKRFDAMVNATGQQNEIERVLDSIGVGLRRDG